jgi:ribA/ribD-fused uncharacterized protein
MTTSKLSEQPPLRTYLRSESVVVFKTKELYGELSNMAGGFPLLIDGVRISTTEALYQACRFPDLPHAQREIIGQHSPMTAKMKSKPYRSSTRDDWDEVRFKIMRWCLRVKLAQHYEEFGRILRATKDRNIVEQSRKDDYWGAKLQPDEETLIGQNVLGRLLMELRERLALDVDRQLTVVEPLGVPNFMLLGKPIGTVTARGVPVPEKPQDDLFVSR